MNIIFIDVEQKVISFKKVHEPPMKFKSYQRKCFIPGKDINVNIIDNERSVTTHLLNPNLWVLFYVYHTDYRNLI